MRIRDLLRRVLPKRPDPRAANREQAGQLRSEVVRHYKAGRHREAEAVARRLLALQKSAVGAGHPDYATGLTNLALLLQAQNDLVGAALLLQEALAIRQSALGDRHPKTLACRTRLTEVRPTNGIVATETPHASHGPAAPVPESEPAESSDRAPSRQCAELAAELAALREAFERLATTLRQTSRRAFSPGEPPSMALLEELVARRREFLGLRDRATRLARSREVPVPAFDGLRSLDDIAELLAAFSRSESREACIERVRVQALAVLDRTLGLSYVGSIEFPPLRDCQAKAWALRHAIATAPPHSLPPEAAELVEGTHPFAALLIFLDQGEECDDDRWATWHAVVSRAFGAVLSAAVARSRILA